MVIKLLSKLSLGVIVKFVIRNVEVQGQWKVLGTGK